MVLIQDGKRDLWNVVTFIRRRIIAVRHYYKLAMNDAQKFRKIITVVGKS